MRSKSILVVMAVCVMIFGNIASADLVRGIDIDFVAIGDAGNAGEQSRLAGYGDTTYYGGVNYEYRIGKYEVTNAQWNAFTSAVGEPTGNPSGTYDETSTWTGANVPTNEVSWYEAAQFCNYLTSGDKSLGAYLFNGNNSNPGDFTGIDRDSAISIYGTCYVLPSEDEWYKAAYYTGSGYSTYANGLETIPAADNGWNYRGGSHSSPWDVGTGTMEQNGTFDMMGNVWEWNETQIGSNSYRGIRGGYYDSLEVSMGPLSQSVGNPDFEVFNLGFRVASIPEPTTILFLSLGSLVLRRKR